MNFSQKDCEQAQKMAHPFSSSEKSVVRQECTKLVRELSNRVKRPLKYFGLPSPWMGDVEEWRSYLGTVLAVEMEERFVPDLVDRAYTLNLFHKLTYYVGDIDRILQNAQDRYGQSLAPHFPIDLINLDYCGGLVYEGFERLAAIESIFRHQMDGIAAGNDTSVPYFLLFITHSSHYTKGKQKTSKEYIEYVIKKDSTLFGPEVTDYLGEAADWYLSEDCPLEYRHKVFVLGKVLEFAQVAGFRVGLERAVAYQGDSEMPMMHYQFKIYPHSLGYPVPADSKISVVDILDWPVVNTSGTDIAAKHKPRLSTE